MTHPKRIARIAPHFYTPHNGELKVYAIIATGGKQYRVQEGDQIKVEKLAGDPGEKVEFNQVLLLADGEDVAIGAPYVDGGKVTGEVQDQARAKKLKSSNLSGASTI